MVDLTGGNPVRHIGGTVTRLEPAQVEGLKGATANALQGRCFTPYTQHPKEENYEQLDPRCVPKLTLSRGDSWWLGAAVTRQFHNSAALTRQFHSGLL